MSIAIVGAGAPAVVWAQSDAMRAHFIDVGQADATLLEFSCGAVLIDAGSQDDTFTEHLVDYVQGVLDSHASDPGYRLASVMVTHNHIDHTRALRRVVEKFALTFEIVDRDSTLRLRRERGMDANPWRSHSQIITSYHYLKQPDVLEEFREAARDARGERDAARLPRLL